jgi:hypothetical protein
MVDFSFVAIVLRPPLPRGISSLGGSVSRRQPRELDHGSALTPPPFRGIVALMAPGSLFLVRHSFFDGLVMHFPPGPISIGARYRSIGPFSFSFPCCRRCGERADGRCGRTRFELLHTILRSFTDLPQTVAALGQSRSELSVCWTWVLEVTA